MFALRPYFSMSLEAFADVLGAFDAEYVEFALDVTEDEIGAGHCEGKAPLAAVLGSIPNWNLVVIAPQFQAVSLWSDPTPSLRPTERLNV